MALIREDLLFACDRDHAAALVLGQLVHHTGRRLQWIDDSGHAPSADLLWLSVSQADMSDSTLGLYGMAKISDALRHLVDVGFIEVSNNPQTPQDRRKRYRVCLEKVWGALDLLPDLPEAERDVSAGLVVDSAGLVYDDWYSLKPNHWDGRREEFEQWLVDTYPVNPKGIGCTPEQARRVSLRFPGMDESAGFRKAVKNMVEAIKEGVMPQEYVPSFDRFAGLRRMYGKTPDWIQWEQWKAPRPRLVV